MYLNMYENSVGDARHDVSFHCAALLRASCSQLTTRACLTPSV